MDLPQAVPIVLAGMAAGTINTVVGSGTLITFPTLLALGYPAVSANVSNNIGLVFGGISGTLGYRRELSGQSRVIRMLLPWSLFGAIVGALLLLRLPEQAFEAVVPVLIAVSVILVIVQPRLTRWTAQRRSGDDLTTPTAGQRLALRVSTGLAGVYGGYFGAAQGVLLVGVLGSLLPTDLQRINALKNLLATVVNLVAAVTFIIVSPWAIRPEVVALIAVGSLIGGLIGARVGRRLPAPILRGLIVVIGVVAIVNMVTR